MKRKIIVVLLAILLIGCMAIALSACNNSCERTGNHTWDEGVITVSPRCDRVGQRTQHCTVCGATQVSDVDKTDHTPVDDNAQPATCGNAGKTAGLHCDVCGEILTAQQVIDALEHKWVEDVSKRVDPTCVTQGVAYYHCEYCKTDKTEDILCVTTHNWDSGVITTDPTCKSLGVRTFHCKVDGCSAVRTEDVALDPNNHEGASQWTVKGEVHALVCSSCNEVIGETHQIAWDRDNGDVKSEPSCTDDGVTEYPCLVPECTIIHEETVEAFGHDFTNGQQLDRVESDCVNDGYITVRCNRCDATENEIIPAGGHAFGAWESLRFATCTVEGQEYRECANYTCPLQNHRETRSTPALGHDVASEWSKDYVGHYHRCSRCNDRVDGAEHDRSVILPASSPTCQAIGKTEGARCSVCGFDVVAQRDIAKLAHTFEKADGKDVWYSDENSHWKKCTSCQENIGTTEHDTLVYFIGATSHWLHCPVCNYMATEEQPHDYSVGNKCECGKINDHIDFMVEIEGNAEADISATTLAEAIAKVGENQKATITVNRDVTAAGITVLTGRNITIKLTGKTYTISSAAGNGAGIVVQNGASLTVINGTIKAAADSDITTLISSCGSLTLTEKAAVVVGSAQNTAIAVDNGTVNINNSAVIEADDKTELAVNIAATTATLTITDKRNTVGKVSYSVASDVASTWNDNVSLQFAAQPAIQFSGEVSCDSANITVAGEALQHQYVSQSVTEADCTNDRTESFKCSVCGHENVVTTPDTALDHNFTNQQWLVENGVHYQLCSRGCGATNSHNEAMSDWSVVDGQHVQSCTKSGCNVTNSHGAEFGDWHEVDGRHVKDCAHCDISVSHVSKLSNWKTEQRDGKDVHYKNCTANGCTYEISHVADMDYTEIIDATCNSVEIAHLACQFDGCSVTEEERGDAFDPTNHADGEREWISDGDIHYYICKVCNSIDNAIEMHEIEWIDDDIQLNAPTCVTGGSITQHCANSNVNGTSHQCGMTNTVVKDALGHNYGDAVSDGETTHTKTCDRCPVGTDGHSVTENHQFEYLDNEDGETHYKACDDCGYDADEAHFWTNAVQTKAPTCTEKGVNTFTCTACEATKTEDVDALGHDKQATLSTDVDNRNHYYECNRCQEHCDVTPCSIVAVGEAEAATCTSVGLTAGEKCSVCGHIYAEQEEIPVLPHSVSSFEYYLNGVHQGTCLSCNQLIKQDCDILGTDGSCSVCGNKREGVEKTLVALDFSNVTQKGNSSYTGSWTTTDNVSKLDWNITNFNNNNNQWNYIKAGANNPSIKTSSALTQVITKIIVTYSARNNDCTAITLKINDLTIEEKFFDSNSGTIQFTITNSSANCVYELVLMSSATKSISISKVEYVGISYEKEHVWNDGEITTSATCTENGEKTFTCLDCGETRTEEISATGHSLTKNNRVEPQGDANGKQEYWTCSKCGCHFEDALGTTKIENINSWGIIPASCPHVACIWLDNGATHAEHCTVCDKDTGVTHTAAYIWKVADNGKHNAQCNDCDLVQQGSVHTTNASPINGKAMHTLVCENENCTLSGQKENCFEQDDHSCAVCGRMMKVAICTTVTLNVIDIGSGKSNGAVFTEWVASPITITGSKGTGSLDPKFYNDGNEIRLYAYNTLTISIAEGYLITNISSSASPIKLNNANGQSVYTFNNGSSQTKPTWFTITYIEWADNTCLHSNVTHYAKGSATCAQAGSTEECYYCSDCRRYYFDEDCSKELAQDPTITPATGHSYGEWTLTSDGSQHQKVCSKCGEVVTGSHNYGEWVAEVPATSNAAGSKGHYQCDICQAYFDSEHNVIDDIVIPSLHVHVESEDYKTNGTHHWKYCAVDGCDYIYEQNGHNVEANAYEHNSRTHWQKCTVCGYEPLNEAEHSYSNGTCACGESEEKSWEKITQIADVNNSSWYVLVCEANNMIATSNDGGKFLQNTSVSISENRISTLPDDAIKFKIEGDANNYKLHFYTQAEQSLGYYTTSAAKSMSLSETGTACSITFDSDGNAVITFGSYGTIKYNSSAPRFVTYASGQVSVQLYRLG